MTPWKLISLTFGGLGFIGMLASIVAAPPEWKGHLVYAAVMIVVAGFMTALGISIGAKVASPKAPLGPHLDRSTAAKALVQRLHARWFPCPKEILDPAYRVSLYVPSPTPSAPKEWLCLARTVTPVDKASSWPHTTDLHGLKGAGVVVYSAVQGAVCSINGVPEYNRKEAKEVERFRSACHISEERRRNLSWPYASIMVNFARATDGLPACTIVVERQDGEGIATDGRMLESELEFAAGVWSATRGHT